MTNFCFTQKKSGLENGVDFGLDKTIVVVKQTMNK